MDMELLVFNFFNLKFQINLFLLKGHGIGMFLNVHEGPMGIGNSIKYIKYCKDTN